MTSLYVIRGRDQGIRFEVGEESTSIGRDASNTIRLHDTEISRRHAEVRKQGADYVLVDLESSNGCFVNQQRVSEHMLKTGDRVRLGRTWMLFTQTDTANLKSAGPQVDIVSGDDTPDPSRIVSTSRPPLKTQVGLTGEQPQDWLERAQSNLEVMLRTAQEVSHTLDIDQLCRRVLELVFEWLGADRGCIMLLDPESERLQVKATRQRKAVEADSPISISQTILDYVLQNEEGVLTSNAEEDERWESGGSIVRFGVREAICVPMQGRYGTVGVIYIDTSATTADMLEQRSANRFHGDHLDLMIAIGHQAALAVEDTAYYSAMLQSERLAAVGHTVATLSHHIKNMLQGMRGGGFLIEEGLKQDDHEAVLRGWKMVERNQEKISDLVLDMLTFSKEREPDLEMGDLNEVVEDVVELMRHRAIDQGASLDWSPSPRLPELCFDSAGMHRAVLNLVTNAIDACSETEHGRVQVETGWDAETQEAIILVRDNGIGISPDHLEHVFKPFESTKGNRGTGLGLPATQKIVREHGGEVHLESTVGMGSTFKVLLPRHESPSESPSHAATQTLPVSDESRG